MWPLLATRLIALLLLSIPLAAAAPPVFDALGQQTGQENSTISFTVHATDADNDVLTYALVNPPSGASLNPQTGQFSWIPSFSQAGSYAIEITASDQSQSVSTFATVQVLNTNRGPSFVNVGPLTVNENTPLQFNVLAIDPDGDALTYSAGSSPSGSSFSGGQFIWTPSFAQAGSHTIAFTASDGVATSAMNVNIIVSDVSTAPSILILGPITAIETSFTSLNVSTSSNATCRYATGDISYDSMGLFDTTGQTLHMTLITGLGGTQTFYLKCRSPFGDTGSASVSITVAQSPRATIALDPHSPVRPGLISVELVSNKQLQATPSLTYYYDESPGEKHLISLEPQDSSGLRYRGRIVISELDSMKTATFEYRGVDLGGVAGTTISSGKTFVADDVPPVAPKTLIATATTSGIELTWHYTGESVKEFRIYRRLSPGVTFVDYHDTINGSGYLDTALDSNTPYYYRITPVDIAGNEGDLSIETSAVAGDISTLQSGQTSAIILPTLSKAAYARLNQTIKDIERAMLDMDLVETTLDTLTSDAARTLAQKRGYNQLPSQMKGELDSLRNELKGLDVYSLRDEDVARQQERVNLKLRKANQTIVKAISIIDDSQSLQFLTPERIDSLAESILRDVNWTAQQKDSYRSDFKEWNQKAKINVKVISATVKYLDGHEEPITIVAKDISYESPSTLRNAGVYERIPKEIAEHASDLAIEPTPTIVESDPLLRFALPETDFQHTSFEYAIKKRVSPESVKGTSSYIAVEPGAYLASKPPTQLSSFSIFPTGSGAAGKGDGLGMIIIVVGTVIIIGLAGVYLYMTERNKKPLAKKEKGSESATAVTASVSAAAQPPLGDGSVVSTASAAQQGAPETIAPLEASAAASISASPASAQDTGSAFYPAASAKHARAAPFNFANGRSASSIPELLAALDSVDDETFSHHVTPERNDFCTWMNDCLGERDLAFKLYSVKDKSQFKTSLLKLYSERVLAAASSL